MTKMQITAQAALSESRLRGSFNKSTQLASNGGFVLAAALCLLALIGVSFGSCVTEIGNIVGIFEHFHPLTGGVMAALPLLGTLKLAPDTGGGGGTMTSEEFQKTVLTGVKSIEQKNAELITNFDNLQKESKKAFEDLANVTKAQSSFEERLIALQKTSLALGRERAMAFGNPIKVLAQDSDFRLGLRSFLAKSLGLDSTRVKGLTEGSTPGSTLIANNEIEREIYDVLLSYGAFRSLDVRTIGTKGVDIPIKTARALATFVDEAAQIGADSTKAGSKNTVTPKKIGCLINASSELIEDDSAGAVMDLLDDLAEAVAYRLDFAAFAADGTADSANGGFTGMFNAGTAATAANGGTTVEDLTFNDVLKCLTTVAPAVLQRSARWWIHPTIIARMLGIKDGNGRPIFLSAIDAPAYGSIGSILGFPVTPVGAALSTNTAGSKVAAFGDERGMAVRIRRDLAIDRSEHFKFDTDEISFRATLRAAAKIKAATSIAVLTLAAN